MKVISLLKPVFLSLLMYILLVSGVSAQTVGGSSIANQAQAIISLSGSEFGKNSNPVTTVVSEICALQLSPRGSLAAPAYSLTALPGQTFYLPFYLKNTGTLASRFDLWLEPLATNSLVAEYLSLILDSNGNGIKDPDETSIDTLSLELLGQATLLLEIQLAAAVDSFGELAIDVLAACQQDPSQRFSSLSLITVPEGGIRGFSKTSTPLPGSSVQADQTIDYQILFTVADRSLNNVVFSDNLDPALGDPENIRLWLNGNLQSERVRFDTGTRALLASFEQLYPQDSLELRFSTTVQSNVLGGTVISNQAVLQHDDAQEQSNEVIHRVAENCAVRVSPEGGSSNPAHKALIFPAEPLSLVYLISNTGNTPETFSLGLETLLGSDLEFKTLSLIHDLNQDAKVQADEPVISELSLEVGETAQVLLLVQTSANPGGNVALIDLLAACADGSFQDADNVTYLSLGVLGASSLAKSAEPAPDTVLYPGAALTYFIDFSARDKDLYDVLVTDSLSELVELLSYSQGLVQDSQTGLSSTVEATLTENTISWHFARIPAGMRVRLELKLRVRSDINLTDETLLENTAKLRIRTDSGSADSFSNTVIHSLRPLSIQLQKTASPSMVSIGGQLSYTLSIANPADSVPIDKLELSDNLPTFVRYLAGSSVLKLPDGSTKALEPSINGQQLIWQLPALALAQEMSVTFRVTVLASALTTTEIINTAGVVASDALGRASAAAAATASTSLDHGGFLMPAVLLGTVFIDTNNNQRFDADSDIGVSGVRLYLADGRSILSDTNGRYTFLDLPVGTASLKVDTTTLPARFLQDSKNQQKEGLWQLRLSPGQILRQDIPLVPAGAELEVRQVLQLSIGPVRVSKELLYAADSQKFLVLLRISSKEALKQLLLEDEGSEDLGFAQAFDLGDVAAGFEKSLSYEPETKDISALMQAPKLSWSLR